MREIKFRVFGKENGIMMEWEDLLNSVAFGDYMTLTKGDNYHSPLMQFTGLIDKNGKEIYEGDIVKYLDEIDGITEMYGFVEWERCWWCVNLDPGYLQENDIMDTDEFMTYEVVGNIYENPDKVSWLKSE